MSRALLPFAFLILATATAAAQKRPLALEDYYRIRNVGAPRISPDSRWVTYTVATPVEETNSDRTEAFVVPADGSAPPARIQHNGADVSNPRWGDDGTLRYTHERATWAVDPASLASPVRVEEQEGTPSPDGKWRVRTRQTAAPVKPAPALSAFEQRHEERFKGDAFDWYPFRQDGQRFPVADRRFRAPTEIFIEPASGGPARQLTRLGLQPSNMRWTPDSRAIVFSANKALRSELEYGVNDLYRVTLDGAVAQLTDDGHTYAGLAWSPDGRWMAYTRSMGTDRIIREKLRSGGPEDLYVQSASGSEPVNLTKDWDLDPGDPEWSPDSRFLYWAAQIGGASHLFRVPAAGGAVEQVTRGERRLTGIDIARDFRRMTYTVGDFDRPSDVWVADIDGRNERRLTDVNRELLAEVELATRRSERVSWKSYDGTVIEGFVTFPHGYDASSGPYPLIVVNHGGPHAASGYGFSFRSSLFAANGYVVFYPNFRSSTGYGDAFKWGTWGSWGTKDGEDVMSGVDFLIARYPVDRNRVGTTGHSYGGIMTNWLITRYKDRFRAAVSGAGESNWTSNFALSDVARTKETEFLGPPWEPESREIMIRQSPLMNAKGVRAATLFIHGSVDYRVPLEGAIQLYTALKKQGVPAKLIIYEGMPHGIRGHWNNVHRAANELRWWETHLKPMASSPGRVTSEPD